MENKKNVTIRDIAAQAGCSVALVCNALSGNGRIGKESKKRILEIADSLGYIPNRSAQSLSKNEISIGVVLPRKPHVIQNAFLDSIKHTFESDVCRVKCEVRLYDQSDKERLFALKSLEGKIDGLIIEMNDPQTNELRDYLLEYNRFEIPAVGLVLAPGILNTIATVSSDVKTSAAIAAQMLALKGCKRVCIISGEAGADIHKKTSFYFKEKIKEYPLTLSCEDSSMDDPVTAYKIAERVLKNNSADSFYVTSYLSPAVCAAVKDSGAKNVTVIGTDYYNEVRKLLIDGDQFAAVFQNQKEQARHASNLLLNHLLHLPTEPLLKGCLIKPELILRSNADCYYAPESGEKFTCRAIKQNRI